MIKTGGRWNPDEPPVYFLASNPAVVIVATKVHTHLLVAVNEIQAKKDRELFLKIMESGRNVLLDSGVFSLAQEHAIKHSVSHNEGLSMAPDQIDGFDDLLASYCDIVRQYGDKLWGYIEIDQGGMKNKIKTRGRLEKLGLRPIPVYHPLNDGWDYFDHLAKNYDRICFGNVVQASPPDRKKLLATAWERRRRINPKLWIHMLGLTATETFNAFPVNSCDSSTWLGPTRWPDHTPTSSANKKFGELGRGFVYDKDADPRGDSGWDKATMFCAYEGYMRQLNIRSIVADYERSLGADIKQPRIGR